MKYKKIILGIILALILFSLMIYSNIEYDNKDPGIKYILQHFDKFYNTKIFLGGRVIDVNVTNHEISIHAPVRPWLINIKVPSGEELPQKGDVVEAYGVLDGRGHVTAEKILAYTELEHYLVYVRSIPAIPFVLILFFRTWRFNIKKFRFERRIKDA